MSGWKSLEVGKRRNDASSLTSIELSSASFTEKRKMRLFYVHTIVITESKDFQNRLNAKLFFYVREYGLGMVDIHCIYMIIVILNIFWAGPF